jgi:hypothetical protein
MGQNLTVLILFFLNLLINNVWLLDSLTLIILLLNRKQRLELWDKLGKVDLALLELFQQLVSTVNSLLVLCFLYLLSLVSNKAISCW